MAWIAIAHLDDLPRVSGCYAIFLGRRLLYVGSAADIRKRFVHHQIELNRINCKTFRGNPGSIRVKYRPSVKYGDWLMVELRLIRRLKPPMNHQGMKRTSNKGCV